MKSRNPISSDLKTLPCLAVSDRLYCNLAAAYLELGPTAQTYQHALKVVNLALEPWQRLMQPRPASDTLRPLSSPRTARQTGTGRSSARLRFVKSCGHRGRAVTRCSAFAHLYKDSSHRHIVVPIATDLVEPPRADGLGCKRFASYSLRQAGSAR